jgi:hypothetical protein
LPAYEKGVPKIYGLDADGKSPITLAPGEDKLLIPLTLRTA